MWRLCAAFVMLPVPICMIHASNEADTTIPIVYGVPDRVARMIGYWDFSNENVPSGPYDINIPKKLYIAVLSAGKLDVSFRDQRSSKCLHVTNELDVHDGSVFFLHCALEKDPRVGVLRFRLTLKIHGNAETLLLDVFRSDQFLFRTSGKRSEVADFDLEG